MNRRTFALALVALPFASRNAEASCPPPYIRQGDPIKGLFDADLHNWARTNPETRATVLLHPMLAHLLPTTGMVFEFGTRFDVKLGPAAMPPQVPWAIADSCLGVVE